MAAFKPFSEKYVNYVCSQFSLYVTSNNFMQSKVFLSHLGMAGSFFSHTRVTVPGLGC